MTFGNDGLFRIKVVQAVKPLIAMRLVKNSYTAETVPSAGHRFSCCGHTLLC